MSLQDLPQEERLQVHLQGVSLLDHLDVGHHLDLLVEVSRQDHLDVGHHLDLLEEVSRQVHLDVGHLLDRLVEELLLGHPLDRLVVEDHQVPLQGHLAAEEHHPQVHQVEEEPRHLLAVLQLRLAGAVHPLDVDAAVQEQVVAVLQPHLDHNLRNPSSKSAKS